MTFERVEAALPEALVRSDPADQLGEARGAELIDPPLPFDPWLDQPRLAQDPQVPRGVRLAQPGLPGDLPDRPRPGGQQIEDPPPRSVGDDVEDLAPRCTPLDAH